MESMPLPTDLKLEFNLIEGISSNKNDFTQTSLPSPVTLKNTLEQISKILSHTGGQCVNTVNTVKNACTALVAVNKGKVIDKLLFITYWEMRILAAATIVTFQSYQLWQVWSQISEIRENKRKNEETDSNKNFLIDDDECQCQLEDIEEIKENLKEIALQVKALQELVLEYKNFVATQSTFGLEQNKKLRKLNLKILLIGQLYRDTRAKIGNVRVELDGKKTKLKECKRTSSNLVIASSMGIVFQLIELSVLILFFGPLSVPAIIGNLCLFGVTTLLTLGGIIAKKQTVKSLDEIESEFTKLMQLESELNDLNVVIAQLEELIDAIED